MNELKIRREAENSNELHELKRLSNDLNLDTKKFSLDTPQANNMVNTRLLKRPALDETKKPSVTDINEKHLKELKLDLKECNPNYKLGREWQVNCQRCAPTFELRRRGYDVTTLPRKGGWDHSGLSQDPFQVWENAKVIKCPGNGRSEIEKNMAQWGNGARAEVVVMWKGGHSGHAFFAEQVDGKTIFIDPQNGSMDVTKYFNRVEPGSVRFCRVDNLRINEKINDCCRRRV